MERVVDHIIIHCSATFAEMDTGAVDIDRWHRKRGWLGNGYHYVIRRDGTVESEATGHRCRSLDKAGAHVGDCGRGWNRRSVGVCLVGGLSDKRKAEDNFTEKQKESLKHLVAHLLDIFGNDCQVMGHRDLISKTKARKKKACPCLDVTTLLKKN